MSRFLLVPLFLLAGCRNSCQQLCVDMADYALESCNLQFSQGEIDSCISDHAGSEIDKDAIDACSIAAPNLEEEWDCEDLRDYFKGSSGE